MIDRELSQSARSPARAILLHSPGRKPWVNRRNTFIEPQRGGTTPRQMLSLKVPLLRSSIRFCPCLPRVLFVPLALTPPWALQECRAYGTHTAQPIQQQAQTTTPNNNLEQQMIDGELGQSAMSPARAILLQSPGREPWVNH